MGDIGSDVSDERHCLPFFEKFQHYETLLEFIKEIDTISVDPLTKCTKIEFIVEQCTKVLDLYQQQPRLLDPYFKELLDRLLKHISKAGHKGDDKYHTACKIIYLLTKVRGYKSVLRYFPHEASDLLLALKLLESEVPTDFRYWQTRYVLLLWLSLLVTLPFHFDKFDSDDGGIPVMERIFTLIKQYTVVPDSPRIIASVMAARFLTRPETSKIYLDDFINWSIPVVKQIVSDASKQPASKIGVPLSLAYIFKYGHRELVIGHAPKIIKILIQCDILNEKQEYTAKVLIKLLQRAGLSLLKARVARWRYNRGKRLLADNLNSLIDQNTVNCGAKNVFNSAAIAAKGNVSDATNCASIDGDDFCVPDHLEDVIGALIDALRHPSHIVRWSAAKGIGRITSRLPRVVGSEVTETVTSLLDHLESDAAWHGGCLALAELSRRGLLLPEKFSDILPRVIQASVFEVCKGNYALGDHVRDAACYVFWAFARAFEPSVIRPYINSIASALLVVSVFDREIHCRRAASAAFQENVGRQGNFPNGIEIITTVDMTSVSRLQHSFINLSEFIAQFGDFRTPLILHLVERKINHWDFEIRLLAAMALSNLCTKSTPEQVIDVFKKLVSIWLEGDMNSKHGAVVGLAYMIDLIMKNNVPEKELYDFIEKINIKAQEEIRLLGIRGKLSRHSTCLLIEKMSTCKYVTYDKFAMVWYEELKQIIFFNDHKAQLNGVKALKALFDKFLSRNTEVCNSALDEIFAHTKSSQEFVRIGAMEVFANRPNFMAKDDLPLRIIPKLLNLIQSTKDEEKTQISWRSSSLICLCKYITSIPSDISMSLSEQINQLYQHILTVAIQDYTSTNMGDVGAQVRHAAIDSIKDLTLHLADDFPEILTEELLIKIVCQLIVHCVSQNLKMRMVACQTLADIFNKIKFSSELQKLSSILKLDENASWSNDDDCIRMFIRLLSMDRYCYYLWLGLLPSFGNYYGQPVKAFLLVINDKLRDCKTSNPPIFLQVLETIFLIHQEQITKERLQLSVIYSLEFLISSGLLNDMQAKIDPLLEQSWQRIKLSKETRKKSAIVGLLCASLRFRDNAKKYLDWLTLLLCSPVPLIRSATSESLYTSLETYLPDQYALNEALEILSNCEWTKSGNNTVLEATNKIRETLGLKKLVKK